METKNQEQGSEKEKKILIVDDEIANLLLTEHFFEEEGFEVCTAASGAEALKILASESFPVILLDLLMPEMNGLELCREIRSRQIQSNIIAVTGHPSKFEFSGCREAGFDGYFCKPVDLFVLLDAVKSGMEGRKTDDRGRRTEDRGRRSEDG